MASQFAPHSAPTSERKPNPSGTYDKTATNDSNVLVLALPAVLRFITMVAPRVLERIVYLAGAAELGTWAGSATKKAEESRAKFISDVGAEIVSQSGLNLTPLPTNFTVPQLEKYSQVPQIPTKLSGLNLTPITVSFANNQSFQDTRWIDKIPRDSNVIKIIHLLALTLAEYVKDPCQFGSSETNGNLNGTLGNLEQRIKEAKKKGIDTEHPEKLWNFLKTIFDEITPNKQNPSPCGGDQDLLKEKLQKALNGIREYVDGLHKRRAVLLEKLESEQPRNQ
jgi:hypothetical protein